ncbi:hypothetical protein E2C01_029793 [Portunus trituberculatus]|uniref:Uncharacterized protein n=1 Tax=Portunus trituberculatus TaxID=210409 RepID=A0A5B7ETD2_PORTR|nr:hypothetical protein [Portunus trituberculatus]
MSGKGEPCQQCGEQVNLRNGLAPVSHTLTVTHRLATTNKQLHHTTTRAIPQHRHSSKTSGSCTQATQHQH